MKLLTKRMLSILLAFLLLIAASPTAVFQRCQPL